MFEFSMAELVKRDIVLANRILARENVIDDFGHVSLRHPENPNRYFLARSRSPELVTLDDIIEYTLEGEPIDQREPADVFRARDPRLHLHGAAGHSILCRTSTPARCCRSRSATSR